MADYSVTENPIVLNRGASSLMRAEFELIQTAIATKVDNTGDTYTGTHDMTGATVTVATPTTATQAATKGYCDALAFATVLPDQTGNSGELVTTNGVTASWTPIKTVGGASIIGSGDIAILGSGGRAITGNLVLTVTSGVIADAAISVTPATPGLYVTLPVATTITTEGVTQISVYNAGDYDYGAKDSAGTQLGWVRPRTGAIIGLADNSTAAGTWAPYGLEKTGITASYVNSTVTNTGSTIVRVALDSNRTCFLFGGTTCYGIIYDASTQTWGTATSVRASIASGAFIGVLAATDVVLVCSNDSTTGMETVTLSITTNTITVNTGTKVSTVLAGNWAAYGQFVSVPAQSAFVLSYGREATRSALRAITVSGTTPTVSAERELLTTTATAANLFVSGSVVRTVAATATTMTCTPCTISGSSTPTAGTAATASTTAAAFRAFLNGNGNIVCHYVNTTHYATIFKLTGTVETASSVSLGTVPASTIITDTDYVSVSAGKTAFISRTSGTVVAINILTDTAGTSSAGTQVTQTLGATASTCGAGLINSTVKFVTSGTGSISLLAIDCSGASPSVTSISEIIGVSASQTPTLYPSDAYGVRLGSNFNVGTTFYSMGLSTAAFDFYSNGTASLQRKVQLPISSAVTNNTNCAVVSGSESYISSSIAGTTGYRIQRIEAA